MEGEDLGRWFSWRNLFVLIILVGVFWFIWSAFFSYEDCKSASCFDSNLRACDKAKFISGDDMIFSYVIRGKEDGACLVDVKLLQGELNNADSKKLEGQEMSCLLPLGVVVAPESDIGVCHGLLKEGLQDLVIRKLHTYLVQNLGRLNLEMAGIPKV
jgi:hypothetical protein